MYNSGVNNYIQGQIESGHEDTKEKNAKKGQVYCGFDGNSCLQRPILNLRKGTTREGKETRSQLGILATFK